MSDRGQAHSLEGISAALMVLLALLLSVQVSVTGPLASNTAREAVTDQLEGVGESTLAIADNRGALRTAVLDWNASGRPAFAGSEPRGVFIDRAPNNEFGRVLNDSFDENRVVYNVDIVRRNGTERTETPLVYSGEPTAGAVTVSRSVTLYDDDETSGGERLADLGNERFYVGNRGQGHVYAVVRVEVTLWRA